jgi:hypothetical protein
MMALIGAAMNVRTTRVALVTVLATACGRSETSPPPSPAAHSARPTNADCSALTGANVVQTEMRMLECTLHLVVSAIGRDQLAAVPPAISMLHAAKQTTEEALHSGAYKPTNGDVTAFVALDEAFHRSLVTLVEAAAANDHAATAAAMGTVLGGCQGCHATFRPTVAPGGPPSPKAPADHAH